LIQLSIIHIEHRINQYTEFSKPENEKQTQRFWVNQMQLQMYIGHQGLVKIVHVKVQNLQIGAIDKV